MTKKVFQFSRLTKKKKKKKKKKGNGCFFFFFFFVILICFYIYTLFPPQYKPSISSRLMKIWGTPFSSPPRAFRKFYGKKKKKKNVYSKLRSVVRRFHFFFFSFSSTFNS